MRVEHFGRAAAGERRSQPAAGTWWSGGGDGRSTGAAGKDYERTRCRGQAQ